MNWPLFIALAVIAVAAAIAFFPRRTRKIVQAVVTPLFTPRPLNVQVFNAKFVSANMALACGDTDGLKLGIAFLVDSLDYARAFTGNIMHAINELRCALRHHDRADTKGPWNRDLSGYGLMAWKNDHYDRDDALRRAWPYIDTVNRTLLSDGLGWRRER